MKRPTEPTPTEWHDPKIEQFNKKVSELGTIVRAQAELLKSAIETADILLKSLDNPVINKAANEGDPETLAMITKGRSVIQKSFDQVDALGEAFDTRYLEP